MVLAVGGLSKSICCCCYCIEPSELEKISIGTLQKLSKSRKRKKLDEGDVEQLEDTDSDLEWGEWEILEITNVCIQDKGRRQKEGRSSFSNARAALQPAFVYKTVFS